MTAPFNIINTTIIIILFIVKIIEKIVNMCRKKERSNDVCIIR